MSGVYISYPFCTQKCSFCNFASGPQTKGLSAEYVQALQLEIQSHTWGWNPDTVYLGGGTPSNLEGEDLWSLLELVPRSNLTEVTVEAAPGSIPAAKARAWREAGINRVSLGVQSFVEAELKPTGRRHSAASVLADCTTLRAVGISNINIDLIAGLPFQTMATWQQSLEWVAKLDIPHVSVYLFELDEDSRLGLEVIGEGSRYGAGAMPSEDEAAAFYDAAVSSLRRIGIDRYEISNFARPGLESVHNLKYWTLQPYIGFGADAHSFDGEHRWGNVETAAEYVACWNRGKSPRTQVSPARLEEERLFTGLRLTRGLHLTDQEFHEHESGLTRFLEAGLIELRGRHVRLTDRGVLLSSEVFEEFIHS